MDDRRPESKWPVVSGPVDFVLFDGWYEITATGVFDAYARTMQAAGNAGTVDATAWADPRAGVV